VRQSSDAARTFGIWAGVAPRLSVLHDNTERSIIKKVKIGDMSAKKESPEAVALITTTTTTTSSSSSNSSSRIPRGGVVTESEAPVVLPYYQRFWLANFATDMLLGILVLVKCTTDTARTVSAVFLAIQVAAHACLEYDKDGTMRCRRYLGFSGTTMNILVRVIKAVDSTVTMAIFFILSELPRGFYNDIGGLLATSHILDSCGRPDGGFFFSGNIYWIILFSWYGTCILFYPCRVVCDHDLGIKI
jgi:hypothetical protein